jgi:hypothetical protein
VSTTGGADPTARLGQEFVTTPSAPTGPLPPGWLTGVLPSRQVPPAQRQLEATADRLGLGDRLPNRLAPLTVFDLTNAPPDVATRAQRTTDLTVTGINFGVPLANTAVDQLLQATGQGDNVPLGTLARGFATGVGVGVPISLAEGRFVSGAFVHPTWQSILADTATRAVLSTAPEPVQQAFADACSDENPLMNAAAWFACNIGQNPNQTPPTLPPAGNGGAIVTDFVLPPTGPSAAPVLSPTVTSEGLEQGAASQPPPVDLRGLEQVVRTQYLYHRATEGRTLTAGQILELNPSIAARFGLTNEQAVELLDRPRSVPPGPMPVVSRTSNATPPPGQPATNSLDTAALRRDMQNGQRELLDRGIQADTAAQVFNNLPHIAEQHRLTPREATLALGGTPSDEVGRRVVGPAIVGPRIVGPRIVGPAIVGPAIVGPCERGMECWGNGEAGILYVGPGEPTATPVTPSSPAPVPSARPVAPAPTPSTRGERPPPPPARSGGNWVWDAVNGAWNWLQEQNAAAEQRLRDRPQEVVRVERNQFFWPTAYEVRFHDGRQGLYDANSGNRLSGSGPDHVEPMALVVTPRTGPRIGPWVMPAGPGGVPIRVPVIP